MAALSALTLLGTSLAACAGPTSSADASEKFNVAVYAGNVVSLYAYIGASEGFYKNEGLDVTLVETTAGPQATAALSSGSIDVMLNSPDNALNAKQQGFDSVVIAGNLKKPLFQLVVKDKADFPHISDPLSCRMSSARRCQRTSWEAPLTAWANSCSMAQASPLTLPRSFRWVAPDRVPPRWMPDRLMS